MMKLKRTYGLAVLAPHYKNFDHGNGGTSLRIRGFVQAIGKLVFALTFLLSMGSSWAGELRFSRHYGDHMVLQREKPVLIRGFPDKSAKVTVSFGGQSRMALT